jgi:hypothetical protein
MTASSFSELSAAQPVTRRGTSVMHYMTRNELKSTDGPDTVLGTVRLQSNEQGHSSKQMLDIRLAGLEADATYRLLAVMGDDTNAFVAGEFLTDSDGAARLSYMSKSNGRGGKSPVPDSISPLTDLRALAIENAATQLVAQVWIADSGAFQYLVKRNLAPEDPAGPAAGSISLIANQEHVQFRLMAGGLIATNDYHLALNGESKMVVQPDADGRVEIRTWPVDAPAVLDLRSLAVWDAGSNVVLRTSLPR